MMKPNFRNFVADVTVPVDSLLKIYIYVTGSGNSFQQKNSPNKRQPTRLG